MWTVLETREAAKALSKAPADVVTKFQAWTAIVQQSGPPGLRVIRGFHDEALAGKWTGFRSSRLTLQLRVIYRVVANEVTVHVVLVRRTTTGGETMATVKKSELRPTKVRIKMTPGEMVRTVRELQKMSQLDLAKAADIPQPTISAIENGRTPLGVERAERLARALSVHPAVLVWPQWEEGALASKKAS